MGPRVVAQEALAYECMLLKRNSVLNLKKLIKKSLHGVDFLMDFFFKFYVVFIAFLKNR